MALSRGLIIKKKFDSSHFIKGHKGGCANLHGHTYHVDLYFDFGNIPLNELNMLVDFKVIDNWVDSILNNYDHNCLNSFLPYGEKNSNEVNSIEDFYNTLKNPTAEFMAEVLYEEINELLRNKININKDVLQKIVVWETEKYAATYGDLNA